MSPSTRERTVAASAPEPGPITGLVDPRAITLLTTEHWSLLSARSLAYNEAFVRGGLFLTFLSMSFVALGLMSSASGFSGEFLVVAALVLAFDLVIGLATFGRILGANGDDLRALHGMARIRHGYVQMAPFVHRYFTTAAHDDVDSVLTAYGSISASFAGTMLYALTTSAGMIGLITAMVGGVLVAVVALLLGVSGGVALVIGIGALLAVFAVLVVWTLTSVSRFQATLGAEFPAPTETPAAAAAE